MSDEYDFSKCPSNGPQLFFGGLKILPLSLIMRMFKSVELVLIIKCSFSAGHSYFLQANFESEIDRKGLAMTSFPLQGWIFIALSTLAIAKNNEHRNLERAEIELDVLRGNAKITYSDEWKSRADILYAKRKKTVAYKDTKNDLCLLEKLEQKGSVNEEYFSRRFHIVNRTLDRDQLEQLGGKKILTFCAEHTSVVLKPYPRDGRRGKPRREERAKREVHHLQANESQVSYGETSKELLEDLARTQSLSLSRSSHGKDLKRNVDGKTENSREHYPSSSAKVAHPPGIDYHTHIRNNIFPGTHAVHPIDITSSVTITTGSSHKVWSYPPSSGDHHNTTATNHLSGTSNLQHGSHQNTSRDAAAHGPQHSFPLHHTYPSSLGQNQAHYQLSANTKPQQSSVTYPPSSTSKTQALPRYPPSSVSKNHQGHTYYPPSATSKSQQPAGYFAPSSSSKTQAPAQYPPSAATKAQRPPEYFPPSSSTKAQLPSYYLPSAAPKNQPSFGHYPPSSSSKTQRLGGYPPSATNKSHPSSAYYPPSSSSKPQQGKTFYASRSDSKSEHVHEHYPPSSFSTPQHYPPSATDKTQHAGGHYPPSSIAKPVHNHYPPSSTSKSHQLQQNITSGNPSEGVGQYPPIPAKLPFPAQYSPSGSHSLNHFVAPHVHQPSHVPPSSTSSIYYHPQNGTLFQYNTLNSYEAVPGMYAPQFPPSSTSKLPYSPRFPSSVGNVNYIPQSENQGIHHRKYPHSFAQYPPSSTAKFNTKLDQSGGHTSHFPPSSTTKIHFPLNIHDSTAPVLEKPSAGGGSLVHGSYPTSSSAKEHPGVDDVPEYPPSTKKASIVPPSGHIYGGTHLGHTHPPSRAALPSPPSSGSPPSAQIPKPPVSGYLHSSLHVHSFPAQYYPPSASVKLSHNIPHPQAQRPVAYHPSSTAKLHPAQNQSVYKHLPPGYFPPSSTSKLDPSIGHRYDLHSGHLAPSQVPYYPPSAFSTNPLNQGGRSHQHYPSYPPSSSSHHMRNESSIGEGKSLPPSSVGHTYSQPQYPPISSISLHQNTSDSTYPSPTMPLHPSGGQYYPSHPPYNVTVSHHHQYQQPNIPPQPHDNPQFQQGSAKPCQGPLYSITTRTIVTPNGVIQRPVSVKNNGESPCGNVRQGTAPYTIPCGAIIKNGHSVKVQNPCTSTIPNQRKSMRTILVPGPAMIPGKQTAEQNELGNSDGVIITNVGESEAEVLDGIGYPVSHQQFSHLKENITSEEAEDLEGEGNQTKAADVGEKEKVEDTTEEASAKQEEEEVKEGDVLEPGDRILGKNGYTISDGFRGRIVSVSGQVGKTRAAKAEKKTNSGQFKYSTELGRYLKDDEGKRFSDCHGEVTFTCSEFLGSNGRAKICKPNPRRNPDGSPC